MENSESVVENKELTSVIVDILQPSLEADTFGKKFILKPSASIAIEGKLSAPARRLFNVLYAFAFDNITQTRQTIALPTLLAKLDNTIVGYERLKQHLEELANITLKWNILGKDGRVWGVASLLSSAEIHEDLGELRYSLAEQLCEPERIMPYARLLITRQNRIQSGHDLTLYEILSDYYNEGLGKSETSWIPLPIFQELLGTNYPDWRNIHRRLIKEPLERLNDLDFTIEFETKRRAKKVLAVKFIMKRKPVGSSPKPVPTQLSLHTTTTFAQLRTSQLYRIVGGTPQVFVKTSDTTAQNLDTKKSVTMANLDVAVELLSNRKP